MAHYDIFREQLAIRFPGYGHALWEPSPGDIYHVVGVGDVGCVSQGRFHRLFNILLPADDPSHQNFGVPDNHEPFKPNVSKHIISGVLCPDNFCSAGVTWESDEYGQFATRPRDPREVSFSCRGKQGALLCLPIQAKREDTVVGDGFGKWMIAHIDLWFAWIRQKGLKIDRMEDVILVTGTDVTRSWANVAFLGGQADARVSFDVEVVQSRINWKFSPERKTGAVWNWRPTEENPLEDQCIFLRGFRVARKRLLLRSKLKAAAGPNTDPKEDDSEPDTELISIPVVPEYRDPLHVILEYIAEERPNCDTVIVHDDDLALLDALGDGTSLEALQPDAVLSCLRSSKPVIHEVVLGADLSSGNGASDDTEIVRVASLSAAFERQQTMPEPPTDWKPLPSSEPSARVQGPEPEEQTTPKPPATHLPYSQHLIPSASTPSVGSSTLFDTSTSTESFETVVNTSDASRPRGAARHERPKVSTVPITSRSRRTALPDDPTTPPSLPGSGQESSSQPRSTPPVQKDRHKNWFRGYIYDYDS